MMKVLIFCLLAGLMTATSFGSLCPARPSHPSRQCGFPCTTNDDCIVVYNTHCLCDGECGLTCFRISENYNKPEHSGVRGLLDGLKEEIMHETGVLPLINLARHDLCHVRYEFKCFTVIVFDDNERTRVDSEPRCWALGGKLADIYSKAHYDMVANYCRSVKKYNNLWLGMNAKIEGSQVDVMLSNGSPAPYIKWHDGWPGTQSTRTLMAMAVRKDPNYTLQGFFNAYPSDVTHGVLCET